MMKSDCRDLERAIREPDGEAARFFEAHLERCLRCRREMDRWLEISEAARSLRKEWPSPGLWTRIERDVSGDDRADLVEGSRRGLARGIPAFWPRWGALAAGLLLAAVSAAVLWISLGSAPGLGGRARDPLLTEQALREVERAEAAYVRSIERLSGLAQPAIEGARTPLAISYREKLRLIDEAILEIRANLDGNRFNAHARAELLAVYRQKSDVLRELMKEHGQ